MKVQNGTGSDAIVIVDIIHRCMETQEHAEHVNVL